MRFRKNTNDLAVGFPIQGVASTKFSIGDPVYIDSNGYLALASTSSKVLGYCIEDVTTAATDMVSPKYVYARGLEMDCDSDQACTQTDLGQYADIGTATSGATVMNLAAGSTGQFLVLGYRADDTDVITIIVAEDQISAAAQS